MREEHAKESAELPGRESPAVLPLDFFRFSILQRYILRHFLSTLGLCLFAATAVFLTFETFERMKVFVREGSTFMQASSYLLFKIPLIVHLMMPIAVLVATLLSLGRLSQLSEITAMRACGSSLLALSKPLLCCGAVISVLMFLIGETILPWATEEVEDIYNIEIKKKDVKGSYSRAHIWFREGEKFYNIAFYDSSSSTLEGISMYELAPDFTLRRRIDAKKALWSSNPAVGWTMHEVVEMLVEPNGAYSVSTFAKLPLIISDKPEDFYNKQRRPETLSYSELSAYIAELQREGIPVTRYRVDLAAKLSFPLVNLIAMLIAIPFSLISARSGNLTLSFVAGVSIGFGYYIVHAVCISLGAAELLPIVPAAWAANILLGALGGYLLTGAEYS